MMPWKNNILVLEKDNGRCVVDYIAIQKDAIEKYKIVIVADSKCWKRMHAHCDGSRRVCKWMPKPSYVATFELLHEIGHVETDKKGMKRCEQESVATLWGIDRMREYGLPIKRKVVARYKKYIKMTYERGLRRGLQKRVKSELYI